MMRQVPDALQLTLGSMADAAEVARLQALLKADPGFREARLTLMTSGRVPRTLSAEQVYWFAENEPKTFLGNFAWMAIVAEGRVQDDLYEEGRKRWQLAVEANRGDADVVDNAAWFMMFVEPRRGADLLEEHARKRADPDLYRRLMIYLEHASELHKTDAVTFAAKALEAGYKLFRLERSVEHCIEALPNMEALAKRSSMAQAQGPLKLAGIAGQHWHRAHGSLRSQLAETVFGLVAMAEVDLSQAEEHFRKASMVRDLPSSPLVSFAAELIASGSTGAVLEILDVWRERFDACTAAIVEWSESVRTGRAYPAPSFPPDKV